MRARLEAWCKNHAHLLVFFGALIVFVTFVLKEGIGEHFREVAEKIDKAEDLYSVKVDVSETSAEVRGVMAAHEVKVKDISVPAQYRAGSVNAENGITRIESLLNIVGAMSERLPKDAARERTLSELKKSFKAATTEVSETYPYVTGDKATTKAKKKQDSETPHWLYKQRHPDSPGGDPAADMSDARPIALLISLVGFQDDVATFTHEVLDGAEVLRKKNETLSDYAWWVSTGLFVMGWSLGLLGKLYGVPGAAGGE